MFSSPMCRRRRRSRRRTAATAAAATAATTAVMAAALIAAASLFAWPGPARAQDLDAAAAETATAAAEVRPPALGQLDEVAREVGRLRDLLTASAGTDELRLRLEGTEAWLAREGAADSLVAQLAAMNRGRLEEFALALARQRSRVSELRAELETSVAELEDLHGQLRELESAWGVLRAELVDLDDAAGIGALVDRLDADLAGSLQAARTRLGDAIALQTRALAAERRTEALAVGVRERERDLRASVARRDSPPLWRALADLDLASVRADAAEVGERVWRAVRDAGITYGHRLAAHLAVALVILVLVLTIRRSPVWQEGDDFPAVRRALGRPVALTVLLAVSAAEPLYPTAQPAFLTLASFLFVVAELVLLRVVLGRLPAGALWLVGTFVIVTRTAFLLPWEAPLQRLALLLVPVGGIALLRMAWPLLDRRPEFQAWRLRPAARLGFAAAAAMLAIATVANLVGALGLAVVVTRAVTGSLMAALGLLTLVLILRDLLALALSAGPLRRLRSIRRHAPVIIPRLRALTSGAAVFLWVWDALAAFGLLEGVKSALTWIFAVRIEVGETALVPGTILILVFSIWLAVYVSRLTRFFLDEDVLPRLSLPRGVPGAVSTSVHYVIIGLALLFGADAAGLDFSRLTIVFGALGVGIGFGLQNIINNFVSGLILLFERPIQVGDNVQVGALVGTVRKIGIRASIVRTYEGSEVIVPNGDLISQQVINYTLSDRSRRLEIPVGVAYGSDLDRAQEAIAGAVAAVDLVVATPPPQVLFQGFGESSLDFRVLFWVADFDDSLTARSAVGRQIERALASAGIQIPFPQRDLHIRTAAPSVDPAGTPAGTPAGAPDLGPLDRPGPDSAALS